MMPIAILKSKSSILQGFAWESFFPPGTARAGSARSTSTPGDLDSARGICTAVMITIAEPLCTAAYQYYSTSGWKPLEVEDNEQTRLEMGFIIDIKNGMTPRELLSQLEHGFEPYLDMSLAAVLTIHDDCDECENGEVIRIKIVLTDKLELRMFYR